MGDADTNLWQHHLIKAVKLKGEEAITSLPRKDPLQPHVQSNVGPPPTVLVTKHWLRDEGVCSLMSHRDGESFLVPLKERLQRH